MVDFIKKVENDDIIVSLKSNTESLQKYKVCINDVILKYIDSEINFTTKYVNIIGKGNLRFDNPTLTNMKKNISENM